MLDRGLSEVGRDEGMALRKEGGEGWLPCQGQRQAKLRRAKAELRETRLRYVGALGRDVLFKSALPKILCFPCKRP